MFEWSLADQANKNLAAIEQAFLQTCDQNPEAKIEFQCFIERLRKEGENGFIGARYEHLLSIKQQRNQVTPIDFIEPACAFTIDLIKMLDPRVDDPDFLKVAFYLSRSCYYTGIFVGTWAGSKHVYQHGVLAPRARGGSTKAERLYGDEKSKFLEAYAEFRVPPYRWHNRQWKSRADAADWIREKLNLTATNKTLEGWAKAFDDKC